MIRPDLRPESELITSTMQCKTCDKSGPATDEFEEGTARAA
ncbi:DUF7848 domain-containing protein [Streptomyces malaysiensis]